MADGADVQSIPTLREWLAALTVYQSDASGALAGIAMEVRRGLDWVHEQMVQWQRSIRDCEEAVVQAKAELAARRFPDWSGRDPDTTVQERNLRRAQAKLEHAEDQVRKCKAWLGKLPKMVEELYSGRGYRLQIFLEGDMVRGLTLLDRRLDALERYADLRIDYSSNPSVMPPEKSS